MTKAKKIAVAVGVSLIAVASLAQNDSKIGTAKTPSPVVGSPGETLIWRTENLGFKGILKPYSGLSLRPDSASGVGMSLEVYDLRSKRLLARVDGQAKVHPRRDNIAEVHPPSLPESMPEKVREEQASLRLELLQNGTFLLKEVCWDSSTNSYPYLKTKCLPANGVVTGEIAQRIIYAAQKEAPNQARRDQENAKWVEEMSRMQHEMQMNIIRNMNSCQPGRYCP